MARKGLFATLEDVEGVNVEVGDVDTVPESVAEVTEGSAELDTGAAEVSDLVSQVEDAVEADGELGDIAEVAQDSVDAGTGMDETAARMTEVAVESIMNRLGMSGVGRKVVVTTEAFGSSNGRVQATRMTVEGLKETIKTVWENIKKFLKMVWQKISDFFGKFFSNSEKLEKAAKELLDKVSTINGKTAAKATFEAPAIAKAFHSGGKVSRESINAIAANHVAMTNGFNGLYKGATEICSMLGHMADKSKSGQDFDTKGLTEALKKIMISATYSTKPEVKQEGDKLISRQGPYVDGRFYNFEVDLKDGELQSINFTIDESGAAEKGSEVETLSQADMQDVLKGVMSLAKETTEYKKNQPTLLKLGSELSKIIDGVIKSAEIIADKSENNGEIRKHIATVKAGVNGLVSVIGRTAVMAPAANVRLGYRALSYVQMSMKQYGEKKDDKAAEKK